MVSDSLRQNGGGTPERNSFGRDSNESVYLSITFTPGKTPAGWTETRTRERGHDLWPHPENPGLIADSDGYYDWAGRRLFLPDGSPDPDISGAYRYQTRPDLCDPNAPDSEPVSPRYEPMWLRHKPGDTWMIGGKPYDPDDPGPYGNPLWRPDRRTGRHRRGERPDPIPPWDWQDGDPEPPDFAATGIRWDAHDDWTPERIAASGKPEDGAGIIPERPAYKADRPSHDRTGQPPSLCDDITAYSGPGSNSADHIEPGWISGSCPDPDAFETDQPSRVRSNTDWAFIHRYSTDTGSVEPEIHDPGKADSDLPDRFPDRFPGRGNRHGRNVIRASDRFTSDRVSGSDPVSDGADDAENDQTRGERPWMPSERQRPTSRGPRPTPSRRPQFWDDQAQDQGRSAKPDRSNFRESTNEAEGGHGTWNTTGTVPHTQNSAGVEPAKAPTAEELYRFPGLRERAWADFLTDSRALYEEHLEPSAPDLRDRLAWFLHCVLWVLALGLIPAPQSNRTAPAPTGSTVHLPQPRTACATAQAATPGPARTLPEAARSEVSIGMAAAAFRAGAARGRQVARTAQPEPIAPRLPHLTFARQAGASAVPTPTAPGARAGQAFARWRPRSSEARPLPGAAQYIAKWERQFDLNDAFGRAVA
jgi:hypothetical protein